MNRKILFSAMSIITALVMAAGATYAFFTSSASSTNNVFASGSLTLLVDDAISPTPAPSVTASFGGTNLVPGTTVTGFLSLHNGGSIAIHHIDIQSNEDVTSSPDLATALNISLVKIGDDSSCTTNASTVSGFTTLAALNAAEVNLGANSALAIGQTRYLCMSFTMPTTISDPTFEGKSITESFKVTADQDVSQ